MTGGTLVLERMLALCAALLVIFGLKRLSSPRTARSGNAIAGWGLALAVLATFVPGVPHNLGWIAFGLAIEVPLLQPAIAVAADGVPQGNDPRAERRVALERLGGDEERSGDLVLSEEAEQTPHAGARAVLPL